MLNICSTPFILSMFTFFRLPSGKYSNITVMLSWIIGFEWQLRKVIELGIYRNVLTFIWTPLVGNIRWFCTLLSLKWRLIVFNLALTEGDIFHKFNKLCKKFQLWISYFLNQRQRKEYLNRQKIYQNHSYCFSMKIFTLDYK